MVQKCGERQNTGSLVKERSAVPQVRGTPEYGSVVAKTVGMPGCGYDDGVEARCGPGVRHARIWGTMKGNG